jgi:hypothetical protein
MRWRAPERSSLKSGRRTLADSRQPSAKKRHAPSQVAHKKSRPEAALNSNLMIVNQAAINDGFWRPMNMAARAETPVTADKVTRVIHRAIKEKPNEIRSQYKKGDP